MNLSSHPFNLTFKLWGFVGDEGNDLDYNANFTNTSRYKNNTNTGVFGFYDTMENKNRFPSTLRALTEDLEQNKSDIWRHSDDGELKRDGELMLGGVTGFFVKFLQASGIFSYRIELGKERIFRGYVPLERWRIDGVPLKGMKNER